MDLRSQQLSPARRTAVALLLLLAGITISLLAFRSLAAAAQNGPLVPASTRVQADEPVSVLYLVRSESATSREVEGWLADNGFMVELVAMDPGDYMIYMPVIQKVGGGSLSRAASTVATNQVVNLPDLAEHDLILIGADTGGAGSWLPAQTGLAQRLAESGLPILGLGDGGHAFFGQLGLEIGHPNGTAVSTKTITAADWGDSQSIYTTPNPITVPQNRQLTLFDNAQPGTGLALEQPPLAGVRIAAVGENSYAIAAADDNKLLWSFNAPPSAMTADGKALLLNTFWYLLRDVTVPLASGDYTPAPGIDGELLDALAAAEKPQIHALMQLRQLPTPAEEAALADAGVTLLGYMAGTTYKTAVDQDFDPGDTAVKELIRWGGLLQPVDKMPPNLAAGDFEAWARNPDGTINLIVTLYDDVPPAEMAALLDQYDVNTAPYGSSRFRMHLTPEQIGALAMEDVVVWIEEGPAPVEITNDEARSDLYVDEVQDLDLSQIQPIYRGLTGSGINVGIFDTGVTSDTFSHPDFAGRLLRTKYDNNGHGTHVAGIVGGSGADSSDLRLRGMAPEVNLIPYKFKPFWGAERMYEALNTFDMDVSNHSYTHGCGGYGSQAANVDELVRGDLSWQSGSGGQSIAELLPTHIYVSAAGNQGNSAQYCRTGFLPGSMNTKPDDPTTGLRGYYSISNPSKNGLIVGALRPNSNLRLQSFSSRGPTWDGRIKPDIVADGSMLSTRHVPNGSGGTYTRKGGTSMAAPAVAGVTALMLEQYKRSYTSGERPQPALIRALIVHTAIDLVNAPGAPGFQAYRWNDPDSGQDVIYHPGPDWSTGYGAVNADRAVAAVAAGAFLTGSISPDELTKEYRFFVPNGRSEIKFTLAWDDEPGDISTATRLNTIELINDLDMELEAPDGSFYYPWLLTLPPRHSSYVDNRPWRETGAQDPIDHATDITPAFQGVNRRDNLEQIQVTDANGLPGGTWKLRVHGYRLPNNSAQPFAIAGDFSMTLNTQPTLRVLSPMPGQSFVQTDEIDLLAVAEDMEDADDNLTIQWWTENSEGVPYLIGSSPNGQTLTINAGALPGCGGSNVPLTARAIDSVSSERDVSQVIKVDLNDPAEISIEAPSNGDSFVDSQTILLRGRGSDARCPDSFDDAKLEWRLGSSNGSLLGSGPEVSTTLPEGNHSIFLIYDEDGSKVSDSLVISITKTPTQVVQKTVLFYAENSGASAPTGEVTDAGGVSRGSPIEVGDDAANAAHRGLVTFDLAPLPDELSDILSADLSFYILSEVSNPYNELIELYAYHVDYGATLEAGDFTPSYLPGRSFIANGPGSTGFKKVSATQSVQDAWTNRVTYDDRLQFAFQFKNGTDNDSTAESVTLSNQESYNNLHPGIEITYEIEEALNPPQTKIVTPSDGAIISDFSNPPNAAVNLAGYGNGPDGFYPDGALKWEYRLVGSGDAYSLAGTGDKLTIHLADNYCSQSTEYEIRLTADNGVLPPGYDYVRIGVRALTC